MAKDIKFRTEPQKDLLLVGDLVCFNCTNPAIGEVYRCARNGSWCDVKWLPKHSSSRSGRYKREDLLLLNAVINAYLVK